MKVIHKILLGMGAIAFSVAQAAIVPTHGTFTGTSSIKSWYNVGSVDAVIGYSSGAGPRQDWADNDDSAVQSPKGADDLLPAGATRTGDGRVADGGLLIDVQNAIRWDESVAFTLGGTMEEGETITFSFNAFNEKSSYQACYGQLWNKTDNIKLAQTASSAWVKSDRDPAYTPVDASVSYTAQASDAGDVLEIRIMDHANHAKRDIYIDNFRVSSDRVPEEPSEMFSETIPEGWLSFHLAHPSDSAILCGDPNPMYDYKGRYHLHYIYDKPAAGYAYAHVSSTDMVHWKWHRTVLDPMRTGHGMYSGTGFFTDDSQPAMIYHGKGSNKNWLTFALDDNLDQWTPPRPVIAMKEDGTPAEIKYWDPDCWKMDGIWYAISGGRPPCLMTSTDLINWKYEGLLFHPDTPWEQLGLKPDEDVSCANMFRIGGKWMLLCISHDMGCRYYLGDFRDGKYLPEFHALMNWRKKDFFAPESFSTRDGRRVMVAWCTSFDAWVPGQSAIQSLPRELRLSADGILRIEPIDELKGLRSNKMSWNALAVADGAFQPLEGVFGDALELAVMIEPTGASEYGMVLFCDGQGNGFPITYRPAEGVLSMGEIAPPLKLAENESLKLRIFIDKGMVEVFANDRQAAVYMPEHDEKNRGISLFAKGGDIQAHVDVWEMGSIYDNHGFIFSQKGQQKTEKM